MNANGRPLLLDLLAQVEVEIRVELVVCQAEPGCDSPFLLENLEVLGSEGITRAVVEGKVGNLSALITEKREASLGIAPGDVRVLFLLLELFVLLGRGGNARLCLLELLARLGITRLDVRNVELLGDCSNEENDTRDDEYAEYVIARLHGGHYRIKPGHTPSRSREMRYNPYPRAVARHILVGM